MFGMGEAATAPVQPAGVYLTTDVVLLLVIAIVLSTGWIHDIAARIQRSGAGIRVTNIWRPVEYTVTLALLMACSLYLVRQGYNPFIYFQF